MRKSRNSVQSYGTTIFDYILHIFEYVSNNDFERSTDGHSHLGRLFTYFIAELRQLTAHNNAMHRAVTVGTNFNLWLCNYVCVHRQHIYHIDKAGGSVVSVL